jgi:hypothetical protein
MAQAPDGWAATFAPARAAGKRYAESGRAAAVPAAAASNRCQAARSWAIALSKAWMFAGESSSDAAFSEGIFVSMASFMRPTMPNSLLAWL